MRQRILQPVTLFREALQWKKWRLFERSLVLVISKNWFQTDYDRNLPDDANWVRSTKSHLQLKHFITAQELITEDVVAMAKVELLMLAATCAFWRAQVHMNSRHTGNHSSTIATCSGTSQRVCPKRVLWNWVEATTAPNIWLLWSHISTYLAIPFLTFKDNFVLGASIPKKFLIVSLPHHHRCDLQNQ